MFCIPKILKNESNSQRNGHNAKANICCFVSQRYWKMKAIHNFISPCFYLAFVVLYPKDTEKWKQFTTNLFKLTHTCLLFCIPKILKNESNSQPFSYRWFLLLRCFVSQRYWKMKAIHNNTYNSRSINNVVLYPKDTEKWKQFTTLSLNTCKLFALFCIPKILKNESNSQHSPFHYPNWQCCFVSQRYWKMKAIHNPSLIKFSIFKVVLYPKDTEKWKQFTTKSFVTCWYCWLFCIPKILKNESNSQLLIEFAIMQ